MGGKYWNPYLAGACAGLVLVLSVWISGNYFGASTSSWSRQICLPQEDVFVSL
jgi:hypothetical protein